MSPQLRETYVEISRMPQSPKEYAERTGMNSQTVHTRFRRLLKMGLIERWDTVYSGSRPRVVYKAKAI